MRVAIAGEPDASRELASSAPKGVSVAILEPAGGGGDAPTSGALAATLVAIERRLEHERPDAVLLADASDTALAAALVGTKMLIPIGLLDGARTSATENGRVLAQLGETDVPKIVPAYNRPL
jgi:hypothetical protein